MSNLPMYEMLARAFASEGVDTVFNLMGDGNFHAAFDQHMLGRALKDSLGYRLQHSFFDIAEIAPMLCPNAGIRQAGLDDWTKFFGLQAGERHNASADALVTAELALILFSYARRQLIDSPARLDQCVSQWRRRQQSPSF